MEAPAIVLGDLQVSGKGQKSIPVIGSDLKNEAYVFPRKMPVPFNPSAYQNAEANRLSLCFTPTSECVEAVKSLEAQIIDHLKPRIKELGLDVSSTNTDWFKSALKLSKQGQSLSRTKINLAGRSALRVWGANKHMIPYPVDWSGYMVTPKIWVKQLYVSNKEIGLVLECTDVSVEPIKHACPFFS